MISNAKRYQDYKIGLISDINIKVWSSNLSAIKLQNYCYSCFKENTT